MEAMAFHRHYSGVGAANCRIRHPPGIIASVLGRSRHILAVKPSDRTRAHCEGWIQISHPYIPYRPGRCLKCSCVYNYHCTDGRKPHYTVFAAALLARGQVTPACVWVHEKTRRVSTRTNVESNSV